MGKIGLDGNKIAEALGGIHLGNVRAKAGYFGAMQLVADASERFRAPRTGGRSTDPRWSERRLIGLAPETLERLQALSRRLRLNGGISIDPMQVAAVVLEKSLRNISDDDLDGVLDAAGTTRKRGGNR